MAQFQSPFAHYRRIVTEIQSDVDVEIARDVAVVVVAWDVDYAINRKTQKPSKARTLAALRVRFAQAT